MLSDEEKPKKGNAIMIALGRAKESAPDDEGEGDSYEDDDADEESGELIGQSILDAIEAGDAKGLGTAVKAAVRACR